MYFLQPVALFLATFTATCTASPLQPRLITPESIIIGDIRGIDNGVQSLIKHLNTYNGGLLSATPILADVTTIHLANRKGFVDANLGLPFNSAASNRVIDFTFASVGVSIPQAVEIIKDKKGLFDAAGITGVVLGSLKFLKDDHDTFSAALLKKTSPDAVPRGAVVVKLIDDALQSGIDLYEA